MTGSCSRQVQTDLPAAVGGAGSGPTPSVDIEYEDDEEALGAAFLGGPVALPYSRLSDADQSAVNQEYLDSLADHRSGTGIAFRASS